MEDDHDDHDGHDDHGDDDNHADDDHDDHWTPNTCHDADTHETHDEYTNKEDCEAAGYMWMDEGSHDDHDLEHEFMEAMFERMFNEADADGDGLLDMTELETLADNMDNMEDGPEMDLIIEIYMSIFDENEDGVLSVEEFTEMMEGMRSMDGDDHDDHGDHSDHGDDHDDHGDDHDEDEMVCYDMSTHTVDESYTNQADCEGAGLMWTENRDDDHGDDMDMAEVAEMMFGMYDANDDGALDESEVHTMFEEMEGEDYEEGVAFIGLHIEEEGEYGIALPEGVELHVLMAGEHDGHDGHDDHGDDHGDHGDNHDDHGDDNANEEIAFDPHSWLDPVAYAAQVEVVYTALSTAFPDNADTFRANADAYKDQLDDLAFAFTVAFGENGTCQKNTVAANHNAYAYISQRYGIQFLSLIHI